MDHLTLPKLLDIPDKLLPIISQFDKYRYFLLKGGRGGGKSQAVGRFILYLCDKYNLRVVCGRETQNSINESVYSLLADLIRDNELNFNIQSSRISSRNKQSDINFRGFREQGAFNIQGMEGIDIVWIDEAQALRKQTLDVLIPTIRKETAKIIFSMNPHVFNDPVVEMFKNREDCLVIDINYDENPFCSDALRKEALECQKKDEKDYRHIWLGEPLDQSDNSVFSRTDFDIGEQNAHSLQQGYGIRVAGFDIARMGNDKCSAFIWQQMGALHWEEVFVDEWGKQYTNHTTGKILEICNELQVSMAAIDVDGLGVGPFDTLRHGRGLDYFVPFSNQPLAYKDDRSFGNIRTLNTFKLKDNMVKGHRRVKNPKVKEQLITAFKYTFDNHQRRILISKDQMKAKYNVDSPDLGDGCIMAESLIDQVKDQQDRQYDPQTKQVYSPEDNLFNIAGIQ